MANDEQGSAAGASPVEQSQERGQAIGTTSVEIYADGDQQRQPSKSNAPVEPEHAYGILKRPMRFDPISVIFTILVLVFGIVGYVNKGSTASLVSGVVFAALLAVGTYLEGARKNPLPLILTLLVLAVVMLWRYSKSLNYFPSALIASLACLLLARHSYLLYLRRKSQKSPTADGQAGNEQGEPNASEQA